MVDAMRAEEPQADLLSEILQSKLSNPERSSDFDLHGSSITC
jgi:hypothetical protein